MDLQSSASDVPEDDILSIIFGIPHGHKQLKNYRTWARAYLDWYRREISDRNGHGDIRYLIGRLRRFPMKTRKEFQADLIRDCEKQSAPMLTPGQGEVPSPPVDSVAIPPTLARILCEPGNNPEKYIAAAVRVMLALELNLWGAPRGVIPWREDYSLQNLVKDIFKTGIPEDGMPSMPIKKNKLRARYLCDYAKVKLVWTSNLAEHLVFQTGDVAEMNDANKVLKIFKYPSFLEAAFGGRKSEELSPSLSGQPLAHEGEKLGNEKARPELTEVSMLEGPEGLKSGQEKATSEEKLVMEGGYYNPDFLWETLMTYRLLFPFQDQKWLEAIIRRSKGSQTGPTDLRLSWPAKMPIPWERREYGLPLRSCAELFKRYPLWAVRLQILYEEADDPTPVTSMGMWLDRHTASRHAFGITIFAFSVTILFGVLSLAVGGAQIWIAFCTWHPSDRGICWTAPTDGTSGR